jgi:hypothetical protein
MPKTTETRIARAVDALRMIPLSPRRWAHYDDATRRWWAVSRADIIALLAVLDEERDEIGAYSLWCADTFARPLTPRQQRTLDQIRYA